MELPFQAVFNHGPRGRVAYAIRLIVGIVALPVPFLGALYCCLRCSQVHTEGARELGSRIQQDGIGQLGLGGQPAVPKPVRNGR